MPRTITSLPVSGPIVGAAVQPCGDYGVLVVTLNYDSHDADHDVDVNFVEGDPIPHSKSQADDVFTFQVEEEEVYEVELTSQFWTPGDFEYQGLAEKGKYTSIVIPLYIDPRVQLRHLKAGGGQGRGGA